MRDRKLILDLSERILKDVKNVEKNQIHREETCLLVPKRIEKNVWKMPVDGGGAGGGGMCLSFSTYLMKSEMILKVRNEHTKVPLTNVQFTRQKH